MPKKKKQKQNVISKTKNDAIIDDPDVVAILDENDLLRLTNLLNKMNIDKLQIYNKDKDLQNRQLQIANYEQKIEALKNEINLLMQIKSNKGLKHIESKKRYDKFVAELTDKYALEPNWGFNEETGEIIQNINNEV